MGSLPFSQLIAKWRVGADLRISGYRNVGAYNVIHMAGTFWGFLAGFLDAGKAFVALAIVHVMGIPQQDIVWVGLLGMIGHIYPIWLGFRGGKGIAVMIGLMFWMAPIETAFAVGTGLFVFYWIRLVNLSVATAYLVMIVLSISFEHFREIQWLILGSIALLGIAYFPRFARWLN